MNMNMHLFSSSQIMGLMKKTQEHYFYWHEIRLLLLLMHTFAARQVIGIH